MTLCVGTTTKVTVGLVRPVVQLRTGPAGGRGEMVL